MKAIKFFAICAFAMVCSLNLNAAEPQLIYNDVVENGKVTGKMVYSMDENQNLVPVNKYEYTYDGTAIASKKGLSWNESSNTWDNRFLLTIDNSTKTCTYAVWVKKQNKFVDTQNFALDSDLARTILKDNN